MPITFSPFPRNTVATFQQERITYRPTGPQLSLVPPEVLHWSTTADGAYTTTRRFKGKSQTFKATAAPVRVGGCATVTDASDFNWDFFGQGNTPCIGESSIFAIQPGPLAEAVPLATVYLLQHDVCGLPQQLTLSQALAAAMPEVIEDYPLVDDWELGVRTVAALGDHFHVTVVMPYPMQRYPLDLNFNPTDLHDTFGPILLPLVKALQQPEHA